MSIEKNLKYNRGGYLVYYYRILKHIIDACIYDTDGLVNFKEFLRVKVNQYNASANAEITTSTSVTSKEPIEDFEAFCQEVFSLDLETATRGMKKYFKNPSLGIFYGCQIEQDIEEACFQFGTDCTFFQSDFAKNEYERICKASGILISGIIDGYRFFDPDIDIYGDGKY